MFQRRNRQSKSRTNPTRYSFLRLPIVKKTFGIIDGEHPSIFKGMGRDFADFRSYEPGDDAKNIDWKSSAKSGQLIVKRFESENNTNLCFLIDSGRLLMTRTVSGERKNDLLETICTTFGYLSTKRLDAVGLVAGDQERIMNERFRLHYSEVKSVLDKIQKVASPHSAKSAYNRVLSYAIHYFSKRTFFVLVFDESQFYLDYEKKFALLRRLKERHDIFAISVKCVNPFSNDLSNIAGKMVDINSHNFIPAYYRRDDVKRKIDKEMLRQRNITRNNFKKLGIPLICVGGSKSFDKKLRTILQRKEVQHY